MQWQGPAYPLRTDDKNVLAITLYLCLRNDLLNAADTNDLWLVKRQTFNAALMRNADG